MSNIFKFHRRTNGGGAALAYGTSMNGGFYAGDTIQSDGIVIDNGLYPNGTIRTRIILAPKSTQVVNKSYGAYGTLRNTSSIINGWSNTKILNDIGGGVHPAANYCRTLTTGGYTDWYLPARNELAICYRHLKPGSQNNSTTVGANPSNAISSEQSNYTTSNPSQTSVNIFKTGGSECFDVIAGSYSMTYHVSNEFSSTNTFPMSMETGGWGSYFGKSASLPRLAVRAIRRIAPI